MLLLEVYSDNVIKINEDLSEKFPLKKGDVLEAYLTDEGYLVIKRRYNKERAERVFGAWKDREDIKNGVKYVEGIRSGWRRRTADIDNGQERR